MEVEHIREALLAVEDTICSSPFNNWRQAFVSRHLHHFFEQFKTMMMFEKAERQQEEAKHSEDMLCGVAATKSSDLACVDVDGMLEMCASMAAAIDTEAGWENLLTLDWMKIDRKPVEVHKRRNASEIYLRGVWTMNLSYQEACDMMFTMSERRRNWDANFTSVTLPKGGSLEDDDLVLSVGLNFGYLINLVFFGDGSGTQLRTRNIRRWNVPTKGAVTYAMVPWNLKEDCIDADHKLLALKVGTISPHPTFRNKCVMTSVDINSMGSMPTWALSFMTQVTAPSMMRSMEQKYIANAREKNDFVDVTPEGRAAREEALLLLKTKPIGGGATSHK